MIAGATPEQIDAWLDQVLDAKSMSEGSLPRRATQLVLDWAELHQEELLQDWELCQGKQQPKPIEPLK